STDETRWSKDTTSPTYAYGTRWFIVPNQSSGAWQQSSTQDCNFKILGSTEPPLEPPVLDTLAVDDIAKTSATLNGEITDVGVGSATARGFVYDTSSHADPGDVAPDDSDYASFTLESGTFGTGVFDDAIASLTPDTTYYVDRKSTRLNSSHVKISYAVFCLKKKTET